MHAGHDRTQRVDPIGSLEHAFDHRCLRSCIGTGIGRHQRFHILQHLVYIANLYQKTGPHRIRGRLPIRREDPPQNENRQSHQTAVMAMRRLINMKMNLL